MPQKRWIKTSPKKSKPQVPVSEKQLVEQQCNHLIETELKPKYILPKPEDNDFNYLVDVFVSGIATTFTSVPYITVQVQMRFLLHLSPDLPG